MSLPDRLTCRETVERLFDYLDRELAVDDVAKIDAHLATCEDCTAHYGFEHSMLEGMRERLRQLDLPPSLRAKVEAILSHATTEEPNPGE